nr:hypothetical protein [Trebonia sp.]
MRIVVADSGIAPDQLHLIFDRFRTGDDGQPRGTGLGLPWCARWRGRMAVT